ncbi:hypothetical protein MFU01_17080 [Myxococcus fulvus]|uniref:Uncharacterized protein n=1 Tax=Myxococcus fulvus TaxID=33 RepID=A0A511SXN6_MYXFU|nr:hypothetical protein MFU01_17080 [Myxococcus fulvus]
MESRRLTEAQGWTDSEKRAKRAKLVVDWRAWGLDSRGRSTLAFATRAIPTPHSRPHAIITVHPSWFEPIRRRVRGVG